MHAPSRRPLALACALLLASPLAHAKVEGHCTYEDKRLDFVDGAAWVVPAEADDDEPGAPAQALAFTTFALDAAALARATDREDAIRDQTWAQDGDHGRLQLQVEDGRPTMLFVYMPPGTSLSRSGDGIGVVSVAAAGAERRGRYEFADDDDQLACTLEFAIRDLGDPADAPPPPGTPLPADGGEPGRAYLAVNAALRAGDLAALATLLPPARVAMMEQARQDPDFDAQLALMKTMAPTDVRITGGRVDGDRAWVEFNAVEFGTPRVGTAEMVREDGRWFVESESTRDP